jgi:hypothetical protein
MTITFWSKDPLILFNKDYINEIIPTQIMTYEQKMNAITRFVIFSTILGYMFTKSHKLILVCLSILCLIFILYKTHYQSIKDTDEGFDNNLNNNPNMLNDYIPLQHSNTIPPFKTLNEFVKSEFKEGTKQNPFSNVLLTDILDDPNRNAAPPAFNPEIDMNITKNIKKMVQFINPEIKNTNKQLFNDLTENFNLDQSNRAFFSTANTRVVNDQTAFGNYLYGNMPSSKESSIESAIQRVKDSYRYTL